METPTPAPPADAVLWQQGADLPALDRPTRWTEPRRVEVAIVGAGYAGLAAAKDLASRGLHVTVFEKEALGWGAHSRNGGMAIPELKAGPARLEHLYGELGLRLHREVNEAFDHLEELISSAPIDCDYVRSGQLYLAHTPRLVPYLRSLAVEHADGFGEPVHFVPREALGEEIGSTAFHGGVVYERTGSLHPAKLHAGLARLALDAGAEIVDHTPVRSFEQRGATEGGSRFRLETGLGPVEADQVLITTNAYADGMLPELARRVLPIGSFIVGTEPLPPDLLAEISPKGRMFVNTRNLLFYWRATPDGRVLFGGRRSLQEATVAEAGEYLSRSLREIHPQLRQVQITHRWGGKVAVTLDRMPHVGRLRGAWYATGCNGSGVALNTWLGHRLAQTITGETAAPAFAELRHRPIPLHRFRRAYLPLVGQWYRYQDRM